MYTKLILRGLLRHQKKGKRLFILLALCSATVIFLMTFRSEFSTRYRELFIGTSTTHLQVLSPASKVFAKSQFSGSTSNLPLFKLNPELLRYIRALPEVEVASPVIEIDGNTFNLDGDHDGGLKLIALEPDTKDRLFPGAIILEGTSNLLWSEGELEVPVLRNRLYAEYGETNPEHLSISLEDLKILQKDLESFKSTLGKDYPKIFPLGKFATSAKDQDFFHHWTEVLKDPNLYLSLGADTKEPYDYRLDDAVVALQENDQADRWVFLNKRLFLALYPQIMGYVREPIKPGKSLSLQVAPPRGQEVQDLPIIIPIRLTGLVDFMPLYQGLSFINLQGLQKYLGLAHEEFMGVDIRLKDTHDTPRVKQLLETYLKNNALELKVADYNKLGELSMATAQAIDIVIGLLLSIFILILIIFVVNMVLLSVIQRKREIGTTTALGLSLGQTVWIMTGEVLVIVGVSWAAGALLATLLIGLAFLWGIPGIIFFPGNKMFMGYVMEAYFASLGLFLFTAFLSALIPLSGLKKYLPVDLLKEAS